MCPHVHHFAFLNSPRDTTRRVPPFQIRDGGAAWLIAAALEDEGFQLGEILPNSPPPPAEEEEEELEPEDRAEVDLSPVAPDDLVLTTTRIPVSDRAQGDRSQVQRGWTTLEDPLFALWILFLDIISRSHVRLAAPMRSKVRPGYEDRREVAFRMRKGASYRERNAMDGTGWHWVPREPRTAAFLLRVLELWPGGPGYLGIFGMDGTSTLIWAWLLRHRAPELLRQPAFVMADLCGGQIPERPTDLSWIGRWNVELVLQHPL
jgi:hypothetical protein